MAWNICLVSDNEAIQHLFTRTFAGRNDISLKFCDTADEAVKEASEDSLHLLVASVSLPDKDGYHLCKELKEDVKVDFPILLMEDIFEDIDLDLCLDVNTDGFIAKPFEEELIAEKIDEMLRSMGQDLTPKEAEEDMKEITPLAEEDTTMSAMVASEEEEGIMDLTDLVPEEETAAVFHEIPVEKGGESEEPEELEKAREEIEKVPPSITTALEESVSEMEAMEAEVFVGKETEEVPPPISAALEEDMSEMEAMEAELFIGGGEEEETLPEAHLEEPEKEAGPVLAPPSLSHEEIEEVVSKTVEQFVQKFLEEKLPGLIRENFAKILSDLSHSVK